MRAILFVLVVAASTAWGQNIPGLEPGQVAPALAILAFKGENRDHDGFVQRFYKSGNFTVGLSGKGGVSEVTVTARDLHSSDDWASASLLFSTIAALSYTGADPERAREWARSHIQSGGGITIGPAYFHIFKSTPTSRMLSINGTNSISSGIVPKSTARARYGDIKKPVYGMDYREAIAIFGEPLMKVEDWAIWSGFKARFLGGMVQEVAEVTAPAKP
jgi:hypothetical protein